MLVTCLLLLKDPYVGIWHDSVLYLGQALSILHPQSFRNDLFFSYGSQTGFTAFPELLAWLLAHFDTGRVFLCLTLVGLLLFCMTSWQLLQRLLPRPYDYYGLLALLLLPSSYGAWKTLHYLEPFLTGRTFAEPLVLAALAALVTGRYWLAAIVWTLAVLMHPLQALPALIVAWLWLALADRRWLHILWLLPIGLLGCLFVPALGFALDRIDAEWYGWIWQRSPIVFYSNSGNSDWYYLLLDVFISIIALRHSTGSLRRYLVAVLCASALLLPAGLLLADWAHLRWPAALQLWRVHWLLHWTAIGVLPWVCVQVWRHESRHRFLVCASTIVLGGIPAAAHPLMPGIALLYAIMPWLQTRLGEGPRRILVLFACSAATIHAGNQLWMLVPPLQMLPVRAWGLLLFKALLPVLLVPAVAAGIWLSRRQQHKTPWVAPLLMLPLTLLAANGWDQRTPQQKQFGSTQEEGKPFGVNIAPSQQVLWLENLLPAWNILLRPQYINSQQMAGIVFNRKTAQEAFRRKEVVHVTDDRGRDCRLVVTREEPYTSCRPDDTAMRHACTQAKGELDYFVLPYLLHAKPRGSWEPFGAGKGSYHLYACRDMLGDQPHADSKRAIDAP